VTIELDSIAEAVAAVGAGSAVIVVDDQDAATGGSLVFPAELATPALIAFMIRYTSGFVQAPITEPVADRLNLPRLDSRNHDYRGGTHTVTVDTREGVSTASRPATARAPSASWPIRPPGRRTSPARATSCRYARRPVACRVAPARWKPRWTSPCSPDYHPPES
jgi:3,4-dihydroxy 2-butanone 4-phosphate synthase / GTP cyclohydrolase II